MRSTEEGDGAQPGWGAGHSSRDVRRTGSRAGAEGARGTALALGYPGCREGRGGTLLNGPSGECPFWPLCRKDHPSDSLGGETVCAGREPRAGEGRGRGAAVSVPSLHVGAGRAAAAPSLVTGRQRFRCTFSARAPSARQEAREGERADSRKPSAGGTLGNKCRESSRRERGKEAESWSFGSGKTSKDGDQSDS